MEIRMSTGAVENWSGNIDEIGAIYPFAGSEVLLVILCAMFYVIWQVIVSRRESREWRDSGDKYNSKPLPNEDGHDM
jgi:hypothetical protein